VVHFRVYSVYSIFLCYGFLGFSLAWHVAVLNFFYSKITLLGIQPSQLFVVGVSVMISMLVPRIHYTPP
jgi:hypothetical protein